MPQLGSSKPRVRVAMVGNGNAVTHGMKGTRTYVSWEKMKYRCLNPSAANYSYYGARGVTVCDRWLDFTSFYADMGDRPEGTSLDRIDSHGDYEPGNCRWATPVEQRANRREMVLQ